MQARVIKQLLGPVARRIRQVVRRGIVTRVRDGEPLQLIQVRLQPGVAADDVQRVQEYGFTSHPHPGAEAVVGAVKGDAGHLVAIAIDDRRYRLKSLAQGEVALYDDQGNVIHIERGQIRVEAVTHVQINAPTVEVAAAAVTIDAPTTTITGNLQVDGNITTAGNVGAQGTITDGNNTDLTNHGHSGVEDGPDTSGGAVPL